MAACPSCGGDAFHVQETVPEPLIACVACGRALGVAPGARLDALAREVQAVRDELARLRQAVNFLNQRVR